MSINSAMLAGVSGLISNSSALAAISDNIANVNTTAYKRNQVNFANVVTAQAVKGRYSAGGVQAVTRQFVSQQGLIQSASSPTDLGISGDGFFVVTDKAKNLTSADQRVFTRSGSFSVDADGFLVNDAKLYLQGWPIAADGTMDFNPSDLTKMDSINVKDLGSAVRATSEVIVNANLNKADDPSSVDSVAIGYDATSETTSMAGYANGDNNVAKPDFTYEMNIIDSAGQTRKIAVAFMKNDDTTAVPPITNQWYAEMYAIPADSIDNANNTSQPGVIASGIVQFTAGGGFDEANSTLFGTDGGAPPVGNKPNFKLGASSDTAAVGAPTWAAGLGIEASDVDIDWTKLTQYAKESSVTSVNPDGAAPGNVVGVEVSEAGVVSAIFDNSEVRQIAKIGLATFANPDGLQPVSGNAYRATIPSGEFVLKQPGVAGAGEIAASTLEASTVDLSAEFTGLITTQKAYSASSKIITTADQMLDELINIKR